MPTDSYLIGRVSQWLAWLAGAIILFGCALPISIDVVSRAITGHTLLESFEIAGYALAACIGLGLGFTVTTKANVRVDILTARLPRPLRLGVDMGASVVLGLLAVAMAWYTFGVLAESWKLGARSQSTLQVPLILPQGIWWAGFVWFATVACLTPALALIRLLSGNTAGVEALVSTADLTDELQQIGVETARAGDDD